MKDKITVLKTSENTGREYVLIEVALKLGGGNPTCSFHSSTKNLFL